MCNSGEKPRIPSGFGTKFTITCQCCNGPLVGVPTPDVTKKARYTLVCPDHALTDRAVLFFFPASERGYIYLKIWLRDLPRGKTLDEYADELMPGHMAECNARRATRH